MKLGLGAAQFGSDYGLTNITGKVKECDVREILQYAFNNNVVCIDTAAQYGDSENVLGKLGTLNFDIFTKLFFVNGKFQTTLDDSLVKLNRSTAAGVLLHNTDQLRSEEILLAIAELIEFKNLGKVSQIGLSIYNPNLLKLLDEHILRAIDLVQAPCNIFDQRILSQEILGILDSNNIKLHARSIFMQGVALQSTQKLPLYFSRWSNYLLQFSKWCDEKNISKLEVCLQWIKQQSVIDTAIVGVTSLNELISLITLWNKPTKLAIKSFKNDDLDLIDPRRWK